MGHPADGLPRPHHAGADRRPEAGDLRLPRRRRRQLPRRRRRRRRARDARRQLAQRPAAARRPGHGVRRRRARATRASSSARSTRRAPGPTPDRRAGGHAAAAAGRGPRRRPGSTRAGCCRPTTPASVVAADLAADIAGAARQRRPPRRPPRSRPATSRCSSAPTSRRAWSATPSPRPACRRCSPAPAASSPPPPRRDWLALLEALEQPHRGTRVAAAALTGFVGWSAERLGGRVRTTDLDELGTPAAAVGRRAGRPRRGRAAGGGDRDRAARAAARAAGRRAAAHRPAARRAGAARRRGRGPARARPPSSSGCAAASTEAPDDISEERSRRLESDADAVQVVTVHRSKGLEFPVVYVPFGWDRSRRASPTCCPCTTTPAPGCSTSAAPAAPGSPTAARRHKAEDAGEDLRLLYVALTRAQCQVVTWWAPTGQHHAPRRCTGCCSAAPRPGDHPAATLPRARRRRRAGAAAPSWPRRDLAVEPVGRRRRRRWVPRRDRHRRRWPPRRFDRPLDTAWRRTSYSRLTAGRPRRAPACGSEPEPGAARRRGDAARSTRTAAIRAAGAPPCRRRWPTCRPAPRSAPSSTRSSRTSTPPPPTCSAELTARAREQLGPADPTARRRRCWPPRCCPPCETPLGPLAGGRAAARHRAARPARRAGLRAAARRRRRPATSGQRHPRPRSGGCSAGTSAPTTRWPPTRTCCGRPPLGAQRLRGYLAGSIDAVLRRARRRATRATSSSTTRRTGSARSARPARRR